MFEEVSHEHIQPEAARVDMVAVDRTDGSLVKLDRRCENWVWECAVWCVDHWSYEGDRIHLTDLEETTYDDWLSGQETPLEVQ